MIWRITPSTTCRMTEFHVANIQQNDISEKKLKPGLHRAAARFVFGDHGSVHVRCALLYSNQGDECDANRDAEIVGAVRGQRFDEGADCCPGQAGDGDGDGGIEFGVR